MSKALQLQLRLHDRNGMAADARLITTTVMTMTRKRGGSG
jgi:hypothetical protein